MASNTWQGPVCLDAWPCIYALIIREAQNFSFACAACQFPPFSVFFLLVYSLWPAPFTRPSPGISRVLADFANRGAHHSLETQLNQAQSLWARLAGCGRSSCLCACPSLNICVDHTLTLCGVCCWLSFFVAIWLCRTTRSRNLSQQVCDWQAQLPIILRQRGICLTTIVFWIPPWSP